MRKVLLIFFSVCCSLSLSAQKIHFTDTSNVWSQFYDAYNDGNPPILTYGIHKYIKDTTIDTVNYKKFDFGIVREDTLLRKVYFRDLVNDSDVVLIDYNLNVGDTFTTNYDTSFHMYYKYVVSGIDSTLINGIWYRVWHFPSIHNPVGTSWPSDIIEGIGCIQHPTYMLWHGIGVEPIDPKIYCFSNQGITPPFSPTVGWFDNTTSCSTFPVLRVNQAQIYQDNTTLYPNPTTSSLTITSPQNITHITITSLIDQTVYTHEYNTPQVQIDVADLPSGIYFVKVNNTEVRKFVKE